MGADTQLNTFPGIGTVRARALEKLGLHTVEDLLRYYPRTYEDRTKKLRIADAPEGAFAVIEGMVAHPPRHSFARRGLDLTKVTIVDESGQLHVTFFNQSYVKDALVLGATYLFYGKVEGAGLTRSMTNPSFESIEKPRFLGRIMPIYPLTSGISNNLLAGLALRAIEDAGEMEERLPTSVRRAEGLCELEFALRNIHFPESEHAQEIAAQRLVFEELFFLSLGLAYLKRRRVLQEGAHFSNCSVERFCSLLPFSPTGAQKRVMAELAQDLSSGAPMNRLVQGDVGSGKTALAAAAVYFAAQSGYQSAMMAPTELLAQQHFRSLSALLAPAQLRICLLTGSTKAAEKRRIYAALAAGEIDLAIGTHALISEAVVFQKLGLVVTDEQHRFGVNQRAALHAKGEHPHGLVMSATPIPRTLALIVYGDLEVSVLDELPPGRTPVKTYLMSSRKREGLYGFLSARIAEGRQVYIVCPMVEEGEAGSPTAELHAVTTYAQGVQKALPHCRVGVIHGKLKSREKEAIMHDFITGETDILVSTTVIEVGVDVPNASVMVIENAERFGLSQLHQLRGRVGRGAQESQCFLISDHENEETRARLKVLRDTNDGFLVAQEDLNLRGPGDVFGARQHGLPELGIADLLGDTRVLKRAQDAAQRLLDADPALIKPEHTGILNHIRTLFGDNEGMFN